MCVMIFDHHICCCSSDNWKLHIQPHFCQLRLKILKMFGSYASRTFTKPLMSRFVGSHIYKLSYRKLCSDQGSKLPKEKRSTVMVGKFKDLFRKYGYIFVGTYLGIYVTTLGSVYCALECDVFSASTFGYDPQTLIKKVKWSTMTILFIYITYWM